jgi:hypothetical protein
MRLRRPATGGGFDVNEGVAMAATGRTDDRVVEVVEGDAIVVFC